MAETRTIATSASVADFIDAIEHPGKRQDARVLDALFRRSTGIVPQMWGPTIIGYGKYHYVYESGHQGDMCRVGFSPRKARHSLYLLNCGEGGEDAPFTALKTRLGKFRQAKGCLYVNKLADIETDILGELVALSWQTSHRMWPERK